MLIERVNKYINQILNENDAAQNEMFLINFVR